MAKAPVAPIKQGTSKAPVVPIKPNTPSAVAAQKAVNAAKATEPVTPEKKYPEIKFEILRLDKALTPGRAKVMLGWETENEFIGKLKSANPDVDEDKNKFGADFFLTDVEGNKVKLKNNTRNRPWSESISKAYMHDILNKQWRFNGETIIIGESGRILSGQHRLVALIFAEQKRASEDEGPRWQEFWSDGPVTIEASIVYGVDESSETTRTIDNVKTRTLSDVIYADTELFGKMKPAERKQASKMLDYAVKLLWVRTGEDKDGGFKPVRTHSTSLSFVDRHKRLRECIAHILEEEKGDQARISQYVYPGHAAALMYMMACSGTPETSLEDYHVKRPTTEKHLKFDNMKKAKMFWSELARSAVEMKAVRLTRKPQLGNPPDGFEGFVFPVDRKVDGGSNHERRGVLAKSWNAYSKDEELTDLELGYKTETVRQGEEEFINYHLVEYPTIRDSIDMGEAPAPKKVKASAVSGVPELGDEGDETPAGDPVNSLEELSEEQGEALAVEAQKKADETSNTFRVKWTADKQQWGDHILLYSGKSGNCIAYFDDSTKVAEALGIETRVHPATGAVQVVVGADEMEEQCQKIHDAGNHILVIDTTGDKGNRRVSPWAPADEVNEHSSDDNPAGDEGASEELEEEVEGEDRTSTEPEPIPEPVKEIEPQVTAPKQPVKSPERLKQVARRVVRKQ